MKRKHHPFNTAESVSLGSKEDPYLFRSMRLRPNIFPSEND
jgi:hypothetical protein